MKDHVAIVVRDGSKILFIQRSKLKKKLPGVWAFPSGTKEESEELYETATRESLEELGVEINIEKIIAEKELSEFEDKLHFILCNMKSGTPFINEPDEIDQIKWMTFQEFFDTHEDSQIGHGLIYLRNNPHLWQDI
jgi:8-oxo-dGTP pyrophosphatase MutT (NUDIX family)